MSEKNEEPFMESMKGWLLFGRILRTMTDEELWKMREAISVEFMIRKHDKRDKTK